jgi:hypothetical protein
MCASEERPSAAAVVSNLRQPMPLGKKLRLIARNYWIRLVKRQGCCGHPGEPGC